jgi:plasmid replication initiation protein
MTKAVGDNTKVGESTKERGPLLPDRHAQGDLFVCDIFDAAPKGDMASMQHPIFSLSTKPDRRIRRYEAGASFVEITPSVIGLATVHDRDVLIYCISQLMAALNEGRKVSKKVSLTAANLLQATNRVTSGEGYKSLKSALERLAGTRITTNITTNDVEVTEGFGLIDKFKIVRETRDGRMLEVEITLSDWVFNAIEGREVLTLSRQYFQLRKPMERRLYELARKHCGQQREWRIGLETLREKMGSNSTPKEFRRLLATIIEDDRKHGHMPDFRFAVEAEILVVTPKAGFTSVYEPEPATLLGKRPLLSTACYEKAREFAKGWDVYAIESDWLDWMAEGGMEPPDKPDGAFLGFLKKWVEKRGPAR